MAKNEHGSTEQLEMTSYSYPITLQLCRVLDILKSMTPARGQPQNSGLNLPSVIAYSASAITIIITAASTSIMNYLGYEPIRSHEIAIKLSVIIAFTLPAAVFFLYTLPSQIITSLHSIWRFRAEADATHRKEILQDIDHIRNLAQIDRELLKLTDKWLAIKIERIDNRNGYFFETPGKLAFISLITVGWGALKEISTIENSIIYNSILLVLAFLVGLTLGAFLLNIVKQRHIYHRQLISITLEMKDYWARAQ